MKKAFFGLVFAMSLMCAMRAQAQTFHPPRGPFWFPVAAQIQVTPWQIRASVRNRFHRPIVCRGRVHGQPRFGMPVWAGFFAQGVFPGFHATGHLWAPPRNPFVRGWANVHCHF